MKMLTVMKMLHPRNPPSQETQIFRWLVVQIQIGMSLNLKLYQEVWVARFGGFRVCSIFSVNCYKHTFASTVCCNIMYVWKHDGNAHTFRHTFESTVCSAAKTSKSTANVGCWYTFSNVSFLDTVYSQSISYGVATVSRIDKVIGLSCRIWSVL